MKPAEMHPWRQWPVLAMGVMGLWMGVLLWRITAGGLQAAGVAANNRWSCDGKACRLGVFGTATPWECQATCAVPEVLRQANQASQLPVCPPSLQSSSNPQWCIEHKGEVLGVAQDTQQQSMALESLGLEAGGAEVDDFAAARGCNMGMVANVPFDADKRSNYQVILQPGEGVTNVPGTCGESLAPGLTPAGIPCAGGSEYVKRDTQVILDAEGNRRTLAYFQCQLKPKVAPIKAVAAHITLSIQGVNQFLLCQVLGGWPGIAENQCCTNRHHPTVQDKKAWYTVWAINIKSYDMHWNSDDSSTSFDKDLPNGGGKLYRNNARSFAHNKTSIVYSYPWFVRAVDKRNGQSYDMIPCFWTGSHASFDPFGGSGSCTSQNEAFWIAGNVKVVPGSAAPGLKALPGGIVAQGIPTSAGGSGIKVIQDGDGLAGQAQDVVNQWTMWMVPSDV